MKYIYRDTTPIFGGEIRVDYSYRNETHIIKLISFEMRYPVYGIDAIFKKGIVKIGKHSRHAIIAENDYLVLYPFRIGKPFLFERENEDTIITQEQQKLLFESYEKKKNKSN